MRHLREVKIQFFLVNIQGQSPNTRKTVKAAFNASVPCRRAMLANIGFIRAEPEGSIHLRRERCLLWRPQRVTEGFGRLHFLATLVN